MAIKITNCCIEGNGIGVRGEMQCWSRCCKCGNIVSGKDASIDKPCVKCQGTVYDAYIGNGKPDWAK